MPVLYDLPCSEETPMTLQVGMVGLTGPVLVGDLRWREPVLLRGNYWKQSQTGPESTKIKINSDQTVAVACAADMNTAGHIAEEIIGSIGADDYIHPLPFFRRVLAAIPESERREAHCTVMLSTPEPRMYSIRTTRAALKGGRAEHEWFPAVRRERAVTIAGDILNAALFWAEKYYRKKMSHNFLIPLGAHMICCAARLNNAGISGLEIVYCDTNGIRRLSANSIAALEEKAEEWDATIGCLFSGHFQAYDYGDDE
jgi:hypothetical protein